MRQIYIRLTAESPLAIRSDHAPGGATTAPYIPGNAFAGSLAAVHRMLASEEQFERFFLSGQVSYPNLYPAAFKDKEGVQERNLPVYPVPKTAQTCKRHKGFRYPEDKDNDGHGVRDNLIDWALFHLGSQPDALQAVKKHEKCSYEYSSGRRCGESMDRFTGYYRRSDVTTTSNGREYNELWQVRDSEYKRLQTRTGIDRQSGTVQEGILYNRLVFGEGMPFWGAINIYNSVSGNKQLVSELLEFLKDVGEQKIVRVGTGRTRGMGKVRFEAELQDEGKNGTFAEFTSRLHCFDRLLHEQMKKELGLQDSRYFFALTLHSPLILCDEFLRYRGTIDERTLLEELLQWEGKAIELERIYQAASVRRLTGWQELWGTPRMNEYAIDAGSVFLFACNVAEGTTERETLLNKLFELEAQGAGERRAEGFGRVCVSDQFHRERRAL